MESFVLNWTSITDFGDSAVALPVAALVLIALIGSGWPRGALAWMLAVAGCAAVVALSKLALGAASGGCTPVAPTAAAFSPSGHTALSTVVYGGLVVLGCRQMSTSLRILTGLGALVWIGLIASSRIAVQAHTSAEVAAGLALGLGAVASMAYLLRQSTGPRVLVPQLAVASAAALLLMYGKHWQIEASLRAIADWVHHSVACAH